jgi:hypothetical protein
MQALPLSQYIFPNPMEADPEGHGLFALVQTYLLLLYLKPIHMVSSLGLTKMNQFVGGVLNHAALLSHMHINPVNH